MYHMCYRGEECVCKYYSTMMPLVNWPMRLQIARLINVSYQTSSAIVVIIIFYRVLCVSVIFTCTLHMRMCSECSALLGWFTICHSIMIIHTPCVLTRTNSFRFQFTAVCLLFVGSALLTTCTLHIHRNV